MTASRPYQGIRNTLPGFPVEEQTPEHRCARCCGPFGKSAIPCPAEFPEIEERARRVAAYQQRGQEEHE